MIEFTKEEVLMVLKTISMIEGYLLSRKQKDDSDVNYVFEQSWEAIDLLTKKIVDEKSSFRINSQCCTCDFWKNGKSNGSYCANADAASIGLSSGSDGSCAYYEKVIK